MNQPRNITYPTAVVILIVALRVAIGWYFFESAQSKNLDRSFSSAGFLSQAKGPLATLYQAPLPDWHGFDRLVSVPRFESPNPHTPGTDEWDAVFREPFSEWQEQIIFDFGRLSQKAAAHFDLSDEQQKRADQIFAFYEGQVFDYLRSNREEIAAYRHELARLRDWQAATSAGDVPYQQDRIVAKEREARVTAAGFTSAIDGIETQLREELTRLASERGALSPLPGNSNPLARFDRFLIVTHFLIGACLVVGFLSRFAAASAGLFLLSVIASQPPWIVGYSTIGYQLVMFIGCLLLVATPSGRWCGIDHFMPTISWCGCCKPKSAQMRTN
ncbi:MAG: DoxX family protein [Pirellulales bacterium]|nr:DoxX family protein [Pirellulales bacterium]